MKYGVVVFPGSNCDHDALYSTAHHAGAESVALWHKETSLPEGLDAIILPGGFSYGDYLRSGAIASKSPLVKEVVKFAQNGGYVIGICNGFQVLTETGLLPGALGKNRDLKFVCKDVFLRVENAEAAFTNTMKKGDILSIGIAHGEGNYVASDDDIKSLEDNDQVVFRYCDQTGAVTDASNPNGSINNIAGIVNKQGNVLGMMPHPERACDALLGSADGLHIFRSLAQAVAAV